MEEMENNKEVQSPGRPRLLSVLCILTFISAGLGAIASLVTPMFQETMIQFMQQDPNFDETQMADTLKVLQAGWGYYLLNFVLAVTSLAGAVLMWKLKKNGFHFYAFANLALLFVPTLVLGIAISWSAIFITVAFIGMYALHLKYMKA